MDLREQGLPGANHAMRAAHRDGLTRIDLDHDLHSETSNASVLPQEIVYQLQLDGAGRNYLFGYRCVIRITPDVAAPQDLQRMHIERFTLEDGLPALEFNRGSSLRDDQGRIWANSIEGAVLYDPAAELAPPTPRQLRLLSAQIEGRDQPLFDGVARDANANNVVFEFALLSYQRDHLTRYRTETHALDVEVATRMRALANANAKLQRASLTDPPTELWNRRYFDLELPRESGRALQRALAGEKHADMAPVLLDLDHFKSINDRYGQLVGDAALLKLAVRLLAVMCRSDLASRWGGETFLIVFRDAHFDAAAMLKKRRLAVVSDQPLIGPYHRIDVTCSIGWAMFPLRCDQAQALSMQQVRALADEAVYRAKDNGHNGAYAALPDGSVTQWQRSGGGVAIISPVLPILPTS